MSAEPVAAQRLLALDAPTGAEPAPPLAELSEARALRATDACAVLLAELVAERRRIVEAIRVVLRDTAAPVWAEHARAEYKLSTELATAMGQDWVNVLHNFIETIEAGAHLTGHSAPGATLVRPVLPLPDGTQREYALALGPDALAVCFPET